MRNGVLVGGNWIIDQVKVVDIYPSEEKLANILAEYRSNGGSAYNILKGLFKMQVSFPLEGIGLVGEDERGHSILEECGRMAINTRQLRKTDKAGTSYTDVMSVRSTGRRTFFHHRGANALLDAVHFDFSTSRAKIFHLGYLLLLDNLDEIKPDGSTGAASVLREAQEQGFVTSVDIVSEDSGRFKKVIPPSLPFIDFLFVNEFEAKMLSDIPSAEENGALSVENCYQAAKAILDMGVREWVIVHFPQGALAVNKHKERIFQPSIKLRLEDIGGAVGAGDAFAAGALTGIHENWPMKKSLALGVCAAATSLFAATSSDSILPYEACLALVGRYGYREKVLAV
ncbi:carbohydrate kinase family protein [soil metagenome]